MKRSLFISLFLVIIATGEFRCSSMFKHEDPKGQENIAYKWGKFSLELTSNDTERFRPRPTVTSRMLALVWMSAFDAWSRYDEKATPLYLPTVARRPSVEHTYENKSKAVSFALYRSMLTYFYSDSTLLREKMKQFGYDPDNNSLDPSTPEGIGNLAANSIIAARMHDGANQSGKTAIYQGKPYSDYTGYSPANTPDKLDKIERWQPKYFSDGNGGRFAPACLTPHWGKVKPVSLDSSSQFRSVPPPTIGSAQLIQEIREVVDFQANLTDEQKALVEFMRDGPSSVQQAGHWLIFAQDVSLRDQHTMDEDVKMYFAVEMAAMDAFIACWDTKMYYDFARPYSLVHDYYGEQVIKAWAGADVGMTEIKATEWRPYSPDTFLCPPFPSYVSGHSTVSGACAEVLRLFTGSDKFDQYARIKPGAATEPLRAGDSVTLVFPTFTEAANMAGISRVMGGYHIQSDNIQGLKLGRDVARSVWSKYLEHVNGTKESL